MQYNLSGQDFRSNNNYLALKFWAPFFAVCYLVQLSISVVLCVNVVQPLALVACICSGLLPVDESCNFLPFLKDFPPRQLSRRQESGTGPEPWGTLAMAFKQLPFSASETALPCVTLIHDRHILGERSLYIFLTQLRWDCWALQGLALEADNIDPLQSPEIEEKYKY